MDQTVAMDERSDNWLESLLSVRVDVKVETLVFAGILVLAVLTRFYDLESRVMSHDESLHTFYSFELEQGRGFQHTPLMHGPLQFHLVGLSYFLFGDSDASARIPAALAGVAAIGLIWVYRRWLGRTGAIVTAALMLISPFMLYYSRYVRNEAFVVLLGLLMFWALFRYYETRRTRWLYLLAVSMALHFATKETAFIYTGLALIFLAILLLRRLYGERWGSQNLRILFLIGVAVWVSATVVGLVALFIEQGAEATSAEAIQPLDPGDEILPGVGLSPMIAAGGLLQLAGLILILVPILMEFGNRLKTGFPSLDLIVVMFTLTLPQLAAIPASLAGWDPLAYQDPASFWPTVGIVLILFGISLAIGFAWDIRRWLPIAGAFFLPFFLFYTTLFTNPDGMATGLVGSLGYWIEQHGVERGSQPSYYYALIQLPFYEYLPVVGALMALAFGVRSIQRPKRRSMESEAPEQPRFPVIPFFGYWAIFSLVGYSFAGERMPWLTVHIALPLIILAGWAIGQFIDSVNWGRLQRGRGWLLALLILILLLSVPRAIGYLMGPEAPFQGTTLAELRTTNGFLAAAGFAIGALIAIFYVRRGWSWANLQRLAGVMVLSILALLTVRTAFRAAYINYDNATEFMVYAHSATGVKNVLNQIEDLSRRTTDGLSMRVAFDDDVSWPINWYLRNYDQALYYGPSPSRDLLNYPVVISGDNNWAKVDPLMKDRYHSFEYIRMWWPMQDYFGLTWDRLSSAASSPDMRKALWDIWLNRDYEAYGEVTGGDYALEKWSPADRMKLYVRKDVGALIWDYGVTPAELEVEPYVDPYADKLLSLPAVSQFGGVGDSTGQLSGPRGMAVAPNGEIYIADAMNHRIQRFSPDGQVLGEWGGFAAAPEGGSAPPGAFNEPWDVAVGPDGTVYVADTWNHRIQRFSAEGEFLDAFGSFGQTGEPTAFWGPRALEIDTDGRLLVADTGNKRVVVFDGEGNPLGEFGGFGLELGGLDEPVGLGLDGAGRAYVADTWNQRVQVFEEVGEGSYVAVQEWPIDGWLSQSLENKPYLGVGHDGEVCVSDPEGYRILCFDSSGEFMHGWGGFGSGEAQFALPMGLAFTGDGDLWVVDGGNNRVMLFEIPPNE